MTSRRFKAEFFTLSVTKDPQNHKIYQTFSRLDHQNYTISKMSFKESIEEKIQTLKVINKLSQIYHKNVLRYYNAWRQASKKDLTKEQFFFQLETRTISLFEYISNFRRSFFSIRNQEAFLRILLAVYLQMIDGIEELFIHGLRQKNLLDFNDIYISNEEIKLGDLKNLEFVENEEKLAEKVLKDLEGVTYKLFFGENPFFRAGKRSKNWRNCEVLKKIEDFFERGAKGRNKYELLGNMPSFFEEMKKFVKFMMKYRKEETMGYFEMKLENQENYKKMVFKVCGKEIRCYSENKDRKPERIFKIKDFQMELEENDEIGIIGLKSHMEIGCWIKGNSKQETKDLYQRIRNILRGKS